MRVARVAGAALAFLAPAGALFSNSTVCNREPVLSAELAESHSSTHFEQCSSIPFTGRLRLSGVYARFTRPQRNANAPRLRGAESTATQSYAAGED